MDINHINEILTEGLIFENRRKLSEYIGEPYEPRTNPQKKQNREWRKYFNFKKTDRKQEIVITEVYERKKENIAVRGGSFPIILDPEVFSVLKVGEYYTSNSIAKAIAIFPTDIIDFHYKQSSWKKIVSQIDDVNTEDLNNEDYINHIKKKRKYHQLNTFVSISAHTIKSRIKSSLERLKRNHLIDFDHGYIIKFKPYYSTIIANAITNGNYEKLKEFTFPDLYDEIMRIIHSKNTVEAEYEIQNLIDSLKYDDNKKRMATKEETKFIDTFYDTKLEELGIKNMQELYTKYQEKHDVIAEFYNDINEQFDKYNITVFDGYYIKYIADIDFDKRTENLQSDFAEELLKSRKKSLDSKCKKRFKNAKIVTDEAIKKAEEKANNYYYVFEGLVDKYIK